MKTYVVTNRETGQTMQTKAANFGAALDRVQSMLGWTQMIVTKKGE